MQPFSFLHPPCKFQYGSTKRTAGDLVRFKTVLKVECTSCGNSRTLTGFEVVKLCGTQDLRRLQRRFKCSLCGAREARLTVLSPPARRD